MKFVNLMPHPIVVRKPDGTEIVIEPSGKVLYLEEAGDVPWGEVDGIPIFARRYRLPEDLRSVFYRGTDTVFIVNLPTLMILRGLLTADPLRFFAIIVAPDTGSGAIRDEQGRIIGTTRFITV